MSMRYPGGFIASTPVTANYPSGVWTQAQAIPYQAQNVWTRDQYWPYTTLLLQGNGTNGAQNNTFLDSSSNNFTITRNGNTTQGSFTPYEANGYWSLYQAAVPSDYINFTTSPGALFEFTGDYTIETWVFPVTLNSDTSLWVTSNSGVTLYHAFNIDATNYNIYLNSGTPTSSFAHGIVVNQWNHVALVRSGSTVTAYTNGVSRGTITNSSTNGFSSPGIARTGGGAAGSSRYLSNLRVVKGTAVYTTNFTPPAVPLTAITNTSLLTCQSNRFIDNSANSLVATITGSPSVQAFQPFPGATTYSGTVLGGSGYFDGSGDYLTAASNDAFRTDQGDWTIEGWIYVNSTASNVTLVTRGVYNSVYGYYFGTSGSALYFESGTGGWATNATYTSTSNAVIAGQWNHIAAVRSGTTFSMYSNGARVFTQASASFGTNVNASLFIGTYFNIQATLNGFMADLRFVKGTALYTGTTYTVPTAPLTAVTNTSLLLNFTNAGIFDAAVMNDLETVGNAQVSTSVVKYGTGSMAFDGTDDRLTAPASVNMAFGTGDFTVEGWFYTGTPSSNRGLFQISGTAGGLQANNLNNTAVYCNSSVLGAYYGGTFKAGTTPIVANTWTHFALVRNNSVTRLYVNGVADSGFGANSDTQNYTGQNLCVGGYFSTSYLWNGNIDDFRVTKGAARYITSFTPPPARMPGQ